MELQLSEIERRMVELRANGLTSKKIAKYISPRASQHTVNDIFRDLKYRLEMIFDRKVSSNEIIMRASIQGLIKPLKILEN